MLEFFNQFNKKDLKQKKKSSDDDKISIYHFIKIKVFYFKYFTFQEVKKMLLFFIFIYDMVFNFYSLKLTFMK